MERSKRIEAPSRRVWPGMDKMISDYDTLERNLRDLRNILAVIAYQQEDHILTIPVSYLEELPPGCELEASFDRAHEQYNFKCILPKGETSDDTKTDEAGSDQGSVG